ncbi:M99 family carboxypeptidase catalytic domain-containing protein [Natrinema halophilum]|uniref:D,L-carboxypeptidase peptidase domain-containing protein n=1 Tax=Natrinema halophilum TaxID=1699371 RepID=A0A7D5GIU2_9EURY|nr:M99 family carboxypeptidase catalytic domain-containing protein [Natrinema halophilum]QLG47790.1 hypothetical protein HYG82_02490 [Natrinema halophilum]
MTAERLVTRIEDGIAAYRELRRSRWNEPEARDIGDGFAVRRSSDILRPGTAWETPLYAVDTRVDGPTVFILAGQQGFEPSGVNAADILRRMTPESGKLLVIPIANKTAVDENPSYHGRHGNMNRNWNSGGRPATPMTRTIWDRFTAADPDLAFDLHSSMGIYHVDPPDPDPPVGQAVFPTDDVAAKRASEAVRQTLNEDYLAQFPYCYRYDEGGLQDGSEDMFSDRVHVDSTASCLLCETTRDHGILPTPKQTLWHLVTVLRAAETFGMTFEESIDDVAPTTSRSPHRCATCADRGTLRAERWNYSC